MQLRNSKVLKFFALILFLLEFLSPAMLANVKKNDGDPYKTHFSTQESSNILLALLHENLTETEENKEDQKDQVALSDILVSVLFTIEPQKQSSLRQRFLVTINLTKALQRYSLFCNYRI